MPRIDENALARQIAKTAGLRGKADNARRLAGPLTDARKHPDIDDRLRQLRPAVLQKVVLDASTTLWVTRNSSSHQQKICRVITAEAQLNFENALRSILGIAKPNTGGSADSKKIWSPPFKSGDWQLHAARNSHALTTGVQTWATKVFSKPKAALSRFLLPKTVKTPLAVRLALTVDVNVQAAGWQTIHGGEDKSDAYNRGFWTAAVSIKEQLDDTPETSAMAVLRQLGRWRAAMAMGADAPRKMDFGRESYGPLVTVINNERYGQFSSAKALSKKIIEWDREFSSTGLPPAGLPDNIVPLKTVEGGSTGYTVMMKDGAGKDLRLSTYLVEKEGSTGKLKMFEDGMPHVTVNGNGGDRPELAEIQRLYHQAAAPSPLGLSPEQRLRAVAVNIGRLHYLLAHKPQFLRGSAGVYDMLAAALLLRHGFVFPGWKPLVGGDIEALSSFDAEEYARNYLGLMRQIPESITNLG